MRVRVLVTLVSWALTAASVQAATLFEQGFETNTDGWFDGSSYGTITRVASGTDGIASASGSFHGVVTESGGSGPFTRFGGYRSVWPTGGYSTQLAVYLDTGWVAGSGFDYSVAATNTSGNHLQDFIFHVTQDTSTGSLLVAGSNNTNFAPRQDLETLNHYAVGASGWYTLEHVFRDNGGVLAVDLNLLDSLGNLLFTETRSSPGNTIPGVVGGNRYGWFTTIDVAGGLAIDEASLTVVPEPATLTLWSVCGLGLVVAGRRRRAAASK